jgi:ubiquinone/menaquinone biosynthesis C-methylase UbiE
VEHDRVGGAAWRVGTGSDLGLIQDAAAELGTLPAGSRVLDVPTGSGVALRGLHPGQDVEVVLGDISATMLGRALASAARLRGVGQVLPVVMDVGALPFDAGAFDMVVSFTGLHCFPEPRRAVEEIVRVLRPGGALVGSSMFTDTGIRHAPLRWFGSRTGVLGPMCTSSEAAHWMRQAGCDAVDMRLDGAFGYFRATRAA